MRRVLPALALSLGLLVVPVGLAAADPDFGPGNSQAGPHDGNSKCHPPGQTVETPGCK